MEKLINFVILTSVLSLSAKIKDPASCKKFPCLIFHDNFHKLDFKTWQHLKTSANTGNNEFQYYTNNRSNSFIKTGVLYLKPTLTNVTFSDDFLSNGVLDQFGSSEVTHCTSNRRGHGCYKKGTKETMINPIQSAAIRTKSFSFRYGKFEARVKLPKGDWIWPAIWLLPKHYVYGRWPASGEIDIMESRGNNHLTYNDGTFENEMGNQMVSQSLHWGPNFRSDTFFRTSSTTTKDKGSYADGFHLYGIDWNRNRITFSVDGKTTLNVTLGKGGFWKLGNLKKRFPGLKNPWKMGTQLAPFDEEFYIVMNVAIGGTNNYFNNMFFPKPPWDNDDGTRNGTFNYDSVGFKAMKQFWGAREDWFQTWHGNNVAMKVDYIKVWSHGED